MIDELSPSLEPNFVREVRPSLLRIHSKKLKGRVELDLCLDEAYDVFASAAKDGGQTLTQELLNETIPAWVLRWATRRQWFSVPFLLLEPGTERPPGKWVTFGDLQAGDSTKAHILKRLGSRIADWEAVSIEQRSIGNATIDTAEMAQHVSGDLPSESHQSVVAPEADHLASIEGFIGRVHLETTTRINKTDIWRVAGYKEPSEFHRFQRNDPRASRKGTERFKTILRMDSKEFLSLRKRLPRREETQ